ncbi:MAG: hypothetical protein ACUVTD_00055 [Nitrososphaerales archaeon]
MKKLLVAGVLIILIAIGTWYAFLGGKEYIDTQILGQEAVAVEVTMTYSPIASSPISDLGINIEARAYKTRVSKAIDLTLDAYHKVYHMKEISGDRLAMYGASVSFTKTITIYNASAAIIFQRTLTFEKASDRTITIYGTINELEPFTDIRIVVDIHMVLTLPAPVGHTIERTIQREITIHVA